MFDIRLQEKELARYIKEISSGNKSALEQFYAENGRWMLAFILSSVKTRESAEEVLQDVMMSIVTYGSNKPIDHAKGWLFKVMVNAAIKKLKEDRSVSTEVLSENEMLSYEEEGLMYIENSVDQIEALRCLNDLEQQCVIMHIFGQMKLTQVAKILDRPYHQIRHKYTYAVSKLRKFYKKGRGTV